MPKITTVWCDYWKMVVKISWLQRKLRLQWTSWTRKMRLIPIFRSMEAHFWKLRDWGFEWKPPGFSILPLSSYMPLGCVGNVLRNSQDGLAKAHLTSWIFRWCRTLVVFLGFFASVCIHHHKTMKLRYFSSHDRRNWPQKKGSSRKTRTGRKETYHFTTKPSSMIRMSNYQWMWPSTPKIIFEKRVAWNQGHLIFWYPGSMFKLEVSLHIEAKESMRLKV